MDITNEKELIYYVFKDFAVRNGRKPNYYEMVNTIVDIPNEVKFHKVCVSKRDMVNAIKLCSKRIESPKITEMLSVNDKVVVSKGTFYFAWEYSFWTLLVKSEGLFLLKETEELLKVFYIDGRYYFAAYWEKEESCGRLLKLYKLENELLVTVFEEHPH